jgi:Zn-finger protein
MREKCNFTTEVNPNSPEPDDSFSPCKPRYIKTGDIKEDQTLCRYCPFHKCKNNKAAYQNISDMDAGKVQLHFQSMPQLIKTRSKDLFKIAYIILKKIKEWISLATATKQKEKMIQTHSA